MKKWHKEPLLHFLIIGALIFVLFSVVSDEDFTVENKKIVVSSGDIERLSTNWERRWYRPPTENELQGLVESYIREEVYYREALALGLDQDDTVLRRRLMQKLQFLTDDLADLSTPDEAALREYLLEHRDKYELPGRISFTHIYFSSDKHDRRLFQVAETVLAEIQSSSPQVLNAPYRGDPFMLQYDFTLETSFEIARLFGQGFADQLFQIVNIGWQGPIGSGYGLHLVRISEKIDARVPELVSVIDKVRTDWMFEQRQKTNKAIYERFKERYEIVIEMPKQPEIKTADGKSS